MISKQQEELKLKLKIQNLSSEEKLPELIYLEFERQVLKGRKVDTIEKTKYRTAIRFAVNLIRRNL